MTLPNPLPRDADSVLKLASRSMFDLFAQTAQGMLVVDREHRIVWISEGYKRFLPALGFDGEGDFVGRRVEEVVPNSLMAQVIDSGIIPAVITDEQLTGWLGKIGSQYFFQYLRGDLASTSRSL